MPYYSKGVIYTIRVGDKLYVGSTCAYTNRKYKHKCDIKDKQLNLYKCIRENNGEWDMKPYKQFPCNNKTELVIDEERVRRELNADLNMYKCNLTQEEYVKRYTQKNKEYYKQNKEKVDEYKNQYNIANKDKIKERNSEIVICECGCELTKYQIHRHRTSQKHIKLMENINCL